VLSVEHPHLCSSGREEERFRFRIQAVVKWPHIESGGQGAMWLRGYEGLEGCSICQVSKDKSWVSPSILTGTWMK